MMDKPFKTVDEQLDILERRGVSCADREAARRFLLKEGYYVAVNGYKEPFVDKQATNLAGEDRYEDGMMFEYFMLLYRFDSALRRQTMGMLMMVENAMKTATVHSFCDVHRGEDAYLDPLSYCAKKDYKHEKSYTNTLIRTLSTLQGIRENRMHKPYIGHYSSKYGHVPLWVVAKCLTFGNMSAFFDLQNQKVKTKTCINIAQALGKKSVRLKELEYAYHTLPEFRNICAHDERLFSTKVGKNNDKGFAELLRALAPVTESKDLSEYAASVRMLIDATGAFDPTFKARVYDGLGITQEDLDALITIEE